MQPAVKIKNKDYFGGSICYGCLSSDRKLLILGEFTDIYEKLCSPTTLNIMAPETVYLCWECVALLRKVKLFQDRVKFAQTIMSSCYDHKSLTSLSNLSATKCYALFIKESLGNTEECNDVEKVEPLQQDKKEENVTEPEGDFDFVPLNDIEDESLPDSVSENPNDDEVEECNSGKFEKAKKECYRKKNYKMTRPKLRDVVKIIAISESEIDAWLERERSSEYYKNIEDKCEKCVSSIGQANCLEEHYRIFHVRTKANKYKCNICEQYLNRKDYEAHVQMHKSYFCCTLCAYECYSRLNMTSHLRCHARVVQCLNCSATFENTRQFFTHYKDMHRAFICDYCKKLYRSKQTLQRHIFRQHVTHKCEACQLTFLTYITWHQHNKLKHRLERSEQSYCVQCDLQFDTVALFRRHLANSTVHSQERTTDAKKLPVPCPSCAKVYTRRTYMLNHFRLVHANKPKHECLVCEKSFLNAARYRAHLEYVHEGIEKPRNKFCALCRRGFQTNRMLANHMRTHTGERPFACAHCDARFTQQGALNTHVKSKHTKCKRRPAARN